MTTPDKSMVAQVIHKLCIRTEPVYMTTPDKSMVVHIIHKVYIRT